MWFNFQSKRFEPGRRKIRFWSESGNRKFTVDTLIDKSSKLFSLIQDN